MDKQNYSLKLANRAKFTPLGALDLKLSDTDS